MLKTVAEVSEMLEKGQWLHISGARDLLTQLPKGNWIGGSIEYFLTAEGGVTTSEMLFVQEMLFDTIKISVYDEETIKNVCVDAYDNGFSIVIVPFDSKVRDVYARYAPDFPEMYLKSIVGWCAGYNFAKGPQVSVVVNGQSKEVFTDKAVVMHVSLPDNRIANIGIINMFTPDENSPIIEFTEDATLVKKCLIDGKEVVLTEYLAENNIDIRVPIIGAYCNANINASFLNIDNVKGVVQFASVVFPGIKYRFGEAVSDYAASFSNAIKDFHDLKPVFSLNCANNYLYGELEGKRLGNFIGPNTFGEIAYQFMNQTMVYLTIESH